MPSSRPLRVLVAGGGFAAAEALLALRAYAGDRITLDFATADGRLAFRPASTTAASVAEDVQSYDLTDLAEATGARLHQDTLEAVAPRIGRARMASGAHLDYDALLLAIGARARVAVPGALTFRDQRDVPRVAAVFDELRAGEVRRLVLAAPAGVTWTLPLYELALYAARECDAHDPRCEVTVVTPERAPLAVFGDDVAAAAGRVLREHGVRVVTGTRPERADHEGVRLAWGGCIPADRVIAVPALVGRRIPGVPSHDFSGFVQTDARGRVTDVERVWAAGDMTTCPIKQGGLAAQQAELAAADIAALAGAVTPQPPDHLVLRAKLLGGDDPLYLRAELGHDGHAIESTSLALDEPPWWPDAKVFGRHVTPWMATAVSA